MIHFSFLTAEAERQTPIHAVNTVTEHRLYHMTGFRRAFSNWLNTVVCGAQATSPRWRSLPNQISLVANRLEHAETGCGLRSR